MNVHGLEVWRTEAADRQRAGKAYICIAVAVNLLYDSFITRAKGNN